MTLTLGTVITAARDRSPYFHRSRVTDAVVARYLTDVQNELIGAAVRRDPQYLAQTANIVIHLAGADLPGAAGAGTTGGTPGALDANGMFSTVQGGAGSLVEAKVTAAEGASVFMADRVVASAVATSVTSTGANRRTNQDAGRVVVITAGTGYGQRRQILSNTAETWVISTGADGFQWTTTPDTTTVFDIVAPNYDSDNAASVFTTVPATTTTTGYLVRVSAQGVPFIDFTAPLVATMDAGVALPSMQFPIDGTVWYADGSRGPLTLVPASHRYGGVDCPSAYVVDQRVFLTGDGATWADVASISVRYTPIAPPFSALTDVFLIPDHARPVLIALAAAFMGTRVAGLSDVSLDPSPLHTEAQRAQVSYLGNISAAKRNRGLRVREVW